MPSQVTEIRRADREDGQPPRCRAGDGPCQYPRRCAFVDRCVLARLVGPLPRTVRALPPRPKPRPTALALSSPVIVKARSPEVIRRERMREARLRLLGLKSD